MNVRSTKKIIYFPRCLTKLPNGSALINSIHNAYLSKNAAPVSVSKEKLMDFDFRTKLHSFLFKKGIVKMKNTYNKTNCIRVDLFPVEEKTPPFILLTFDRMHYYLNPCSNYVKQLFDRGHLPPISSVLFTKFDLKTALGVLPSILVQDNISCEILNIVGPRKTRKLFTDVMPQIRSFKAKNFWKTMLNFIESTEFGVVKFNQGPITVKIFRSEAKSSKQQMHGYIFEYSSDFDYSTYTLQHSWKNFSSIESYLKYIKEYIRHLTLDTTTEISSIAVLDFSDCSDFQEILPNLPMKELLEMSCCVHIAPRALFYSRPYSKWLSALGRISHVLVDDIVKPNYILFKQQSSRGVLHNLHPSFFPLYASRFPLDCMQKLLSNSLQSTGYNSMTINGKAVALKFNSMSCETYKKMLNTFLNCPDFPAFENFNSANLFPHLVVLGSGSGAPSFLRASPCYLLRITKSASILIDSGGDSLSQLRVHYGHEMAREVISTIKGIVLTHKHADHWSGFYELLSEMYDLDPSANSLIVFLPTGIKTFFIEHCSQDERFRKVQFLALQKFKFADKHFAKDVFNMLHIKALKPVQVDHGPPTFGIVLQLLSGEKITYSSDTLPMNKDLIKHGRNSNLLIHDSLYVTENEKSIAQVRMHSTAEGAIETARLMYAETVMLTHFATLVRFVPINVNNIEKNLFQGNIVTAFDHLELPLCKLNDYALFLKELSALYTDHDKKHEESRNKLKEEVLEIYEKFTGSQNAV